MEVLKQPQYRPLAVEQQIVIIFAATKGYLDKYPLTVLRRYEEELYAFLAGRHEELLALLRERKAIDHELDDRLRTALEQFAEQFTVKKD